MKLSFTAADEQFREEVADWLNDNLQESLPRFVIAVGRVMSITLSMSEKPGSENLQRVDGPALAGPRSGAVAQRRLSNRLFSTKNTLERVVPAAWGILVTR